MEEVGIQLQALMGPAVVRGSGLEHAHDVKHGRLADWPAS